MKVEQVFSEPFPGFRRCGACHCGAARRRSPPGQMAAFWPNQPESTGPQKAVTLRFATSPLCEPGSQRPCPVVCPGLSRGENFMTGPSEFLNVQNGIPTGKILTPGAALYLHNGRGLAAYTHNDVLYSYFLPRPYTRVRPPIRRIRPGMAQRREPASPH
jgi:hypothetical protein